MTAVQSAAAAETRRDRGPSRPAAEHETSEVALEEDGIAEVGWHLLTCRAGRSGALTAHRDARSTLTGRSATEMGRKEAANIEEASPRQKV